MLRAIAFFLVTVVLDAQTASIRLQEIQRAQQLLSSPGLADKAWGAYLAAGLHSPELDSLLTEQLQSAAAFRAYPFSSPEHAFVTVLLGASIEADLKVPAALLEPFKESWTDSVVILLVRTSDSEDVLMQLSTNQLRDPVWLAANNLLFGRKSQAWFSAVLSEIKISHQFFVTDATHVPGTESGMGGGACGDGAVSMPTGFPPVTLYELEDTAQPGSTLFAPGPQDVYFRKKLVPSDKQVGIGSCSARLDRNALLIDYLASLGDQQRQQSALLFRGNTHLIFSGADDLRRQMDTVLQAQETAIREFIHTIEQKNQLRATSVHLSIVPEVTDARGNTTEPLPQPPSREFDLL